VLILCLILTSIYILVVAAEAYCCIWSHTTTHSW